MKKKRNCLWNIRQRAVVSLLLTVAATSATLANVPATTEQSLDAPHDMHITIKMIGPVTQTTDLQIICVLKHDPAGDPYIEAAKDLNDKLGGLLSSLRDRGQFIGEPGETFLFTPPPNSITPSRVLLIGVGEESKLTLDCLRLAGRIAAREAVRLNVAHVSFAPTLRDQKSTRIDVGEGDAAFVEQFLLAYDTEKRLQAESLSPKDDLKDLTIEAGPKFFNSAVEKVTTAIASAAEQIKERTTAPYQPSIMP
jgi:leucyl aminopeptidase